jgi:hypothetical protein
MQVHAWYTQVGRLFGGGIEWSIGLYKKKNYGRWHVWHMRRPGYSRKKGLHCNNNLTKTSYIYGENSCQFSYKVALAMA